MKKIMLAVMCALALFACDNKEKVSFESVEAARKQANENALFNAQVFRASQPFYQKHSIISAADSTQTAECPQGDGWETLTLHSEDKTQAVKIKCSTVSSGIGCVTESEYQTKSYAQQDGKCNADVPFPLPKIQK